MKNIQLTPVDSSNVESIGYDATKGILAVKFKSGGHYAYHNVSAADYASLSSAKSVGSHISKHIVPKFKAQKL